MSFSREWDRRFAEKKSWSAWPWSDLVSAVARYSRPFPGMRVLELGCGIGANARFFLESGCDYFAVEGSASAVSLMRERIPELRDRVDCADFTVHWPFSPPFDLVVDRSAITHNSHAAIEQTLGRVRESLRPGGVFIGIDWFSTKHSEFGSGETAGDDHTLRFDSGPFAGVGCVHFADEHDLRNLFSAFDIERIDEKIIQQRVPERTNLNATLNIVARRP